jgi:hypothetical protein
MILNLKEFLLERNNGLEVKTISNKKNQLGLDTEGIQIFESSFIDGESDYLLEKNAFHSIFILSGNLSIKDQVYQKGDFIIVDNEKYIELSHKE